AAARRGCDRSSEAPSRSPRAPTPSIRRGALPWLACDFPWSELQLDAQRWDDGKGRDFLPLAIVEAVVPEFHVLRVVDVEDVQIRRQADASPRPLLVDAEVELVEERHAVGVEAAADRGVAAGGRVQHASDDRRVGV